MNESVERRETKRFIHKSEEEEEEEEVVVVVVVEEVEERKWETGHWTDVSRPEALPVAGTKWADTIIC